MIRRLAGRGVGLVKAEGAWRKCTSSVPSTAPSREQVAVTGPQWVQVYDGKYRAKLQWLRRVSFSSSVLSIFGFPIAFHLGAAASMPLIGQIMIAGTAVLTSVSSTIFLQTITSPYVGQLKELHEFRHLPDQRRFSAQRIDLFGNIKTTEFQLKHVERVNSSLHPFATFCDAEKKEFYYIFGDDVLDATLKARFGAVSQP